MAENKMKEVAKLLGVEMGVPFRIVDKNGVPISYNPFTIQDKGLYDRCNDYHDGKLSLLLNGVYEIEILSLTQKEKSYLEGVLKPFKDRGVRICKIHSNFSVKDYEYIKVCLNRYDNVENSESFSFPYFHKGEMYKCMELNKKYTLQELGLFEDD